jgi:hypothetical protein
MESTEPMEPTESMESTEPEEKKVPGLPGGEEAGGRRSGEGPQFYYSRERRLLKAPASVRALYEDKGASGFNLLRPLVSTKSNAVLFGTMVVLVFITLVMSFSGLTGEKTYRGNRISVSALRYEGAVLVVLKKTGRPSAYTGPLDIAVSPADAADSPPYPHRVTLSSRRAEEFRFSVPFDGPEFLITVSASPETAGETDSLAFKIKSK